MASAGTTPGSLHAVRIRGLLEISRIVRDDDALPSKLERIADAIAACLGFHTVAINIYRPEWDDFCVEAISGSAGAREALLGAAQGWDFWRPLLDPRWERDGAYLILEGEHEWEADPDKRYVPDLPTSDDPDAWSAEDALLAPLLASDGHVLGILAVDEPDSGRRPTDEEIELLVAVAAHAAQAIESAQESERAASHREALERLLDVSAQLAGTRQAESILQTVCDVAREALGFDLAVIELADRDADRYRPVAAAGTDLSAAQLQIEVPIAGLEAIFDPQFEREGCYLLEREEALARVGAEPVSFASTRNGRGPRAWNRHWLVAPWRDADGAITGFIWVDDPADRLIPDRLRLQGLRMLANHAAAALDSAAQFDALQAAEELHSTMLEASPIGIISLDREGRVRSWNDAARRMFGFDDSEVVGRTPPWAVDEGYRERFRELVENGAATETVFADQRADGTLIDVRTTSAPVRDAAGNVTGVVAAIEDITERKRAAADLERRTSELEALHVTTLELLDRREIGSTLETIVSRAAELLGARSACLWLVDTEADELEAAIGFGAFDDSKGFRLRRGEGLAGKVWESDEPITVEDYSEWAGSVGEFAHVGFHGATAVPIRFGFEVLGVLGLAYDEPGRTVGFPDVALLRRFGHLAALALNGATLYDDLRKSQELYRAIVESSSELFALLDLEGNPVYISPSYEAVLGYTPDELLRMPELSIVHPDDVEEAAGAIAAAVEGRRTSLHTNRLRHKDGRWITLEGTTALVRNERGEPGALLVVARDVTERLRQDESLKEMEEQLRQSQKMDAIGQLAGGIAHDFNNLLTAITGYGDLALAKLDPSDSVYRNVDEMRRAGERAATLTRQLLAFGRKQVLQPKVLNLNEAVEGIESMLSRLLGEQVELSTVLAGDLGYTRADPGQIEQVLVNLAINARDAMPDGGRLTVTTANVELDELFTQQHAGAEPGQYVMLAVEDTGCGMSRETLDRIFDPFFTTKPAGQGTGLGLSTVYGIVTQTGGQIWAYSELGLGSSFKVYLPRVWERVTENVELVQAPRRPGTETILLVEDEEIVRSLVQEMLEDDGYSVLAAASGSEALEVAETYEGRIDVLLTDVVMPGLSGQQVAGRLVEARPDVRVVFTSGYNEDAIANHGVLRPGTAFLEKPFTAPDLARTLRGVLDRELVA
jgi:PAS domain S-box-containing protein